MKTLLFILFLIAQAFGVSFDADDFNNFENIHNPIPELLLWRSTYRHRFDKLYPTIFAVPTTDPAEPLGERTVGWILSPAEGYREWWNEEPCLYITINGLAKSITIATAKRPGWIRKNVVVDCFDIDGEQIAHNFTNIGRRFTTAVGEYTISSVAIWTSGQMSIDDIEIDHIPEPATLGLVSLGLLIISGKKRRYIK